MIQSPIKFQPDSINIKEILPKISWHTHLKNSKPYTLILQTAETPLDGFFTCLFFALTIILTFSGLLLHSHSRLPRVNIKWIKVPTVDFERKK